MMHQVISGPSGDMMVSEFPEFGKFELHTDLGTVEVPIGYKQPTCLANFHKNNKHNLRGCNPDITDENFKKVTTRLVAGQRFHVCAWKQTWSGITTSVERLAFLVAMESSLVGAQGLSLVYEQKRKYLPRGYWYASLDKKEALWKDSGDSHRVPGIDVLSTGRFRFVLGHFNRVCRIKRAFLSFCEE